MYPVMTMKIEQMKQRMISNRIDTDDPESSSSQVKLTLPVFVDALLA
jgi:hypothetical protein